MGNRGANKSMAMNKKGQVFILITIVIMALLFVSFEISSIVQERNSIKTRISTMESILYSIEENLQRQIYISGFRIIFLANEKITNTGQYINLEEFFNQAFFNGTVEDINNSILLGITYNDIITSINQKADKINVIITLSNSSINITQEDPWHIKFTLISDFIMQDKTNLAKWEKQQIISAYIPISSFEDPIYIINTNAQISRKINQTIYHGIYTNNNDVTNLLNHLNRGYYASNPSAPSFLNRLEGNFSADINGIESLVDLSQLSQQGILIKDKSSVDYIYFSQNNPEFHLIAGMPSWFRLDTDHLAFYNVTGLAS